MCCTFGIFSSVHNFTFGICFCIWHICMLKFHKWHIIFISYSRHNCLYDYVNNKLYVSYLYVCQSIHVFSFLDHRLCLICQGVILEKKKWSYLQIVYVLFVSARVNVFHSLTTNHVLFSRVSLFFYYLNHRLCMSYLFICSGVSYKRK